MQHNPNEWTLSSSIMSTNFAPRSWGAMDQLEQFREKSMTTVEFEGFLANYDLSRKQFCEHFGIGESTLSGWLNGKGIPEAYGFVLQMAEKLDTTTEQLQRMAEALDAAQYDMRVVKDGDTFASVEFPMQGNFGAELQNENRQPIGEIIMRGATSREKALSVVRTQSLLRTMRRMRDELAMGTSGTAPFGNNYREEVEFEVNMQLGENPLVGEELSPMMKELSEMLMKGTAQDAAPAKGP